eukprot:gb/GECH01009881.1/.p1 GENE.gb/GECH01009881.1/~~gb/GECH01009881.1/.p1  ORF type:complete len:692 (+),score=87.24 gb/GECH01009881.1/:1-2076(+)
MNEFLSLAKGDNILVPRTYFSDSTQYEFILNLNSKSSRSASTSVIIQTSKQYNSFIDLINVPEMIPWRNRIILFATANVEEDYQFKWVIRLPKESLSFGIIPSNTHQNIAIDREELNAFKFVNQERLPVSSQISIQLLAEDKTKRLYLANQPISSMNNFPPVVHKINVFQTYSSKRLFKIQGIPPLRNDNPPLTYEVFLSIDSKRNFKYDRMIERYFTYTTDQVLNGSLLLYGSSISASQIEPVFIPYSASHIMICSLNTDGVRNCTSAKIEKDIASFKNEKMPSSSEIASILTEIEKFDDAMITDRLVTLGNLNSIGLLLENTTEDSTELIIRLTNLLQKKLQENMDSRFKTIQMAEEYFDMYRFLSSTSMAVSILIDASNQSQVSDQTLFSSLKWCIAAILHQIATDIDYRTDFFYRIFESITNLANISDTNLRIQLIPYLITDSVKAFIENRLSGETISFSNRYLCLIAHRLIDLNQKLSCGNTHVNMTMETNMVEADIMLFVYHNHVNNFFRLGSNEEIARFVSVPVQIEMFEYSTNTIIKLELELDYEKYHSMKNSSEKPIGILCHYWDAKQFRWTPNGCQTSRVEENRFQCACPMKEKFTMMVLMQRHMSAPIVTLNNTKSFAEIWNLIMPFITLGFGLGIFVISSMINKRNYLTTLFTIRVPPGIQRRMAQRPEYFGYSQVKEE